MKSFDELNLSSPLLRAITELGYTQPSPIQAQALPILLGHATDFIGLAATGTGKTAAFGIPLLQRIDPTQKSVQALILCPTRELAIQVSGQINLLAKFTGAKSVPIYGGASFVDQIHNLKKHPSIVVGTPGRVVDHINRGTLRLEEVKTVILDEADEMISMGFKDDLEAILGTIPTELSNIWLFSATMSGEVRKVAEKYLKSPQQVQVNRTEMVPATIEQLYYATQESNKPEVLCKLIDAADDFYGLVFCQTKSLVDELNRYLKGRGYAVDCLHGDMDQNARERTMKLFRDRKVTLLICTDVASRGLDVKDITHVINYSIPRELDNYVHRIGRTARSGKTGFAMNLVTPSHRGLIGRVEKMTKSRMKEGKIPTRKEIGMKKVTKTLEGFQAVEGASRAVDLMDPSWKAILAGMNQEEVAGRFLSLLFPELFAASPAEVVGGGSVKIIDRSSDRSGEDREQRPRYGSDRPRSGGFGRDSGRGDRDFGRDSGRDSGGRRDGGGFGGSKRSFGKSFGDRSFGEKSFGDRSFAGKSFDKPEGLVKAPKKESKDFSSEKPAWKDHAKKSKKPAAGGGAWDKPLMRGR